MDHLFLIWCMSLVDILPQFSFGKLIVEWFGRWKLTWGQRECPQCDAPWAWEPIPTPCPCVTYIHIHRKATSDKSLVGRYLYMYIFFWPTGLLGMDPLPCSAHRSAVRIPFFFYRINNVPHIDSWSVEMWCGFFEGGRMSSCSLILLLCYGVLKPDAFPEEQIVQIGVD